MACRELGSSFIRCREEDDYQKKLATLLAEIRRLAKVPRVDAINLLAFPENLGRFYFISNRVY